MFNLDYEAVRTDLPKVSIIIPVYNVEKYLRQCLDSACNQTLKEIEIICVNDGSPDGSALIIDEYALRDPRVKPIHKKNGGYASAVNAGIKVATGEFIAILESDDYVTEEYYFILYNEAVDNNLDICRANSYLEIREYMPPILHYKYFPSEQSMGMLNEEHVAQFLSEGHAGICLSLYKRKFIIDNKIYLDEENQGAYQDVDFAAYAYVLAQRIKIIETYGYNYRRDVLGQSVSSTTKIHCIITAVNNLWKRIDSLAAPVSPLIRTSLISYSLSHLIHYWNVASNNNLQTIQSLLFEKIEQLFVRFQPTSGSVAIASFAKRHHLTYDSEAIFYPSKALPLYQYPSIRMLQRSAASYAQIAALFYLKAAIFFSNPTQEDAKLIRDDLFVYLNITHQPNTTLLKLVKDFFSCSSFFTLLKSYPDQLVCFLNFCLLNGETEALNTLASSIALNKNLASSIVKYPNVANALRGYTSLPLTIKKSCHVQRGMVQSDNFFHEYIKGKSIAVVGNAPSQLGLRTGAEIDAHDIVIRFNNYIIEGYEDDYGKKADVWAVTPGLHNLTYRPSLFLYDFLITADTGQILVGRQLDFIYEYINTGGNYFRLPTNELQKEANMTVLSLGLLLAGYLMEHRSVLKELSWYGFAFNADQEKKKQRHYFADPIPYGSVHDWEREKILFEKITHTQLG